MVIQSLRPRRETGSFWRSGAGSSVAAGGRGVTLLLLGIVRSASGVLLKCMQRRFFDSIIITFELKYFVFIIKALNRTDWSNAFDRILHLVATL